MAKHVHFIIIGIILTPLFFWTLTPNLFSTPKEILISFLLIISFAIYAYSAQRSRSLTTITLTSALPLIFFAFSIIASLLANPEGRPEAIQSKGLTLINLSLITYLLASYQSTSIRIFTSKLIMGLGSLLSLHSLLSLTLLSKSAFIPRYMQNISFTPTGSYPITLFLIIFSASFIISYLRLASKTLRLWLIPALALHIISATAIISLMLPGGALATSNPSFSASWSIALDALKSLRSLFFGIGLSNYSLLFTSVKPLTINATSLWNTLPSTAFSEILTLLPTAGILATMSFIYLMFQLLLKTYQTRLFIPSILISLSFFVIPATSVLYLLFFLLYALAPHHSSTHPISRSLAYLLMSISLILITTAGWISGRSLMSERYILLAQQKLSAADTQGVYQYHLKAIETSPKVTNYHLSFSDVNFKLASALSQKENLTEADRQTIAQLISQSIDSGKTAITLRPNDSRTWFAVAKIYQNLINVAEGSENFAIEAYTRAIALDRANPNLRLEYASLLSQIADTKPSATESAPLNNRATSETQVAIQLKPDLSAAYYNLAMLYKKAGNPSSAQQALEAALKYLSPDSPEYLQVQGEIASLTEVPLPSLEPSLAPDSQ